MKNCQGVWAWVGQRGIDAFTIQDFAPVEAVFCCDYGEGYSKLWGNESLFSVEKDLGRRENWGNQDLEKLWEGVTRERIDRYIENVQAPINTVCYRSIEVLEKDRRFRVLAPSIALKDRFDNKFYQLELFARLGIKTPTTFVRQLGEMSFTETSDYLDGPFVVQPPVGSSGENTYIIKDRIEFDRVKEILGPDQHVKVSKYLPVPSLNGHCVVLHTRKGLHAMAVCPSVQIVGAHHCTNRAEIYCGNDFTAASSISEAVRENICTIMEDVGLYMGRKGFLGIFGMDFLLDDDQVLALEINPRFQGSTMLLSLLQLEREEVPLAALHVMQFMGLVEGLSQEFLMQLGREYRIPYSGAHLIVHNLKGTSCCAEYVLKSGIHTLENDTIEMIRSGTTYCDVKSPREWCILGNLPLPDTEVCQDARLAMVHTSKSILDSNLQQLLPSSLSFVNRLQSSFKMIPLDGGNE
ncbi:MAG: ATP-grasp domain-containing protein [Desulfobacterales bacterium]|nr:MAG: ATP-grasp domain-containing protein [Desulfobacterales bacterium]